MGINLETVCNHQLFYDVNNKEVTAQKMLSLLNSMELYNEEFLIWFYKQWEELPDNAYVEKEEWKYYYDPEEDTSKEDSGIEFSGPYDLDFTLLPNIISFFSPPFRYWQWYLEGIKDSHIEPWRAIYHFYTKSFGGNKLVYFHDTMPEVDLIYYPDTTVETIIKALRENHTETFEKYHPKSSDMNFDFYVEEL
ncbi:hypothetical protein OBK24_07220 [Empedobacter falsenii]